MHIFIGSGLAFGRKTVFNNNIGKVDAKNKHFSQTCIKRWFQIGNRRRRKRPFPFSFRFILVDYPFSFFFESFAPNLNVLHFGYVFEWSLIWKTPLTRYEYQSFMYCNKKAAIFTVSTFISMFIFFFFTNKRYKIVVKIQYNW